METVKFKLSLDSLGEIYQLNHWKELNLRKQPLSLLTSARVENVSSAPYYQPTEGITHQVHAYTCSIIPQST